MIQKSWGKKEKKKEKEKKIVDHTSIVVNESDGEFSAR